MVVVGSDVHKRTHTFVAVDEVGRKLAEITVKDDHTGHDRAIRWARDRLGDAGQRRAVEDCRHSPARLEIDLLEAGELVVRVPPKLMAEQRRLARTRGKSDPIDALAGARGAPRAPGPPGRCLGPRGATRTCRSPPMTRPPGSCGCWWTAARTWSPNAPG